jgi:hypothetical protein
LLLIEGGLCCVRLFVCACVGTLHVCMCAHAHAWVGRWVGGADLDVAQELVHCISLSSGRCSHVGL